MSRRSSDGEERKSSRRTTITSKWIPHSGRRTEGPRHLQPDVPGKFHHSLTQVADELASPLLSAEVSEICSPPCATDLGLSSSISYGATYLTFHPWGGYQMSSFLHFLMDLGKQVAVGGARPGEQPPPSPAPPQGFLPPCNLRRLISASRSSKFRPGGARSRRLLGAFHEIFTKTSSSTLAFSWTEGS